MMPGFLLDETAQVTCAHQGKGKPIVRLRRVTITMGSGPPRALVGETTAYVISGCPHRLPPTMTTRCPCTMTVNWTAATRVTAMGVAVLLSDSTATCIPNNVPTNVIPAQTRVRGV